MLLRFKISSVRLRLLSEASYNIDAREDTDFCEAGTKMARRRSDLFKDHAVACKKYCS
jgi:hypothetical protein